MSWTLRGFVSFGCAKSGGSQAVRFLGFFYYAALDSGMFASQNSRMTRESSAGLFEVIGLIIFSVEGFGCS